MTSGAGWGDIRSCQRHRNADDNGKEQDNNKDNTKEKKALVTSTDVTRRRRPR